MQPVRHNGDVTSRRAAVKRRPKARVSLPRVVNLAVTVAVLCLGPVLIGVGNHLINVDEELTRTGTHASGTIVDFDDVTEASERRMEVDFFSADGTLHRTWAAVDHDQHPVIGEDVTVVYREQSPGNAVVLGFESDGVWFRGVGVVLTSIFGGLGVIAVGALLIGYLRKGKTARGRASDSFCGP